MNQRPFNLTVDYLWECFEPDFDEGVLIWRERPVSHFKSEPNARAFNTKFAGNVAGCISNNEYRKVYINAVGCLYHRILYMMYSGSILQCNEWIDHIDTDRTNNSINNLRVVTKSQNAMNRGRQSNNTSGVTGVSWCKERDNWEVHIKVDGRKINLGRYADLETAKKVRKNAEQEYFGEYQYRFKEIS